MSNSETITIVLTTRAAAFLDAVETAHNARRVDEQAEKERIKADARAAAERGETFHGHPHPVGCRQETPALTREELAAHIFERGAMSTLHVLTRSPDENPYQLAGIDRVY